MTIRFVSSSGDTTGATDAAAINAALSDSDIDTVVLDGNYYVNDTITSSTKTLTGVTVPVSVTWPATATRGAVIRWAGSSSPTTYMVKCSGGVLANLYLSCLNNCRGVAAVGCKYIQSCVSNIRIQSATNVACDLVDCWGSSMHGIHMSSCRGIGLRLWRCNSVQLYDTRINSQTLFRNTNSTLNTTTWETACDSGQAAAEALEGYTTDWPDAVEEVLQDTASNYVQTTADSRAACVIGAAGHTTDQVIMHGLLCEATKAGEYPVICSHGYVVRLQNVRTEGSYLADCVLRTINASDSVYRGTSNVIDGAVVSATKYPKYLIRGTSMSRYLQARNIHATASQCITEAVIACDGGTHYSPRVESSYVGAGVDYIVALNGATVNDPDPALPA